MGTYKNGNTIVSIQDDGTKIRYVPDNVVAQPQYPESIDLKVCNRCEMNCAQCHECSTWDGKLGDLSSKLIDSLHPYTEVAVGGGDPFLHPNLTDFLQKLKKQEVIANITVHWLSFIKNIETLRDWSNKSLIHGLGVSINEIVPEQVIKELQNFPHAVVHTIVGITNNEVLNQLVDKNLNILFLGYKYFGRGKKYSIRHRISISSNTNWLANNLPSYFERFRAVSFDNLAIKQVRLKNMLRPDVFDKIYMGDDGTFTMYVDLVENKYAVSSTSTERFDIDSDNIDDLFANIRKITCA